MTPQDKMISSHSAILSSYYGKRLKFMHFKEPYILEEYGVRDSVVSNSVSKREAYITRHLLTCDVTHSLILSGSFYDRL
jgi:hypothetical protein